MISIISNVATTFKINSPHKRWGKYQPRETSFLVTLNKSTVFQKSHQYASLHLSPRAGFVSQIWPIHTYNNPEMWLHTLVPKAILLSGAYELSTLIAAQCVANVWVQFWADACSFLYLKHRSWKSSRFLLYSKHKLRIKEHHKKWGQSKIQQPKSYKVATSFSPSCTSVLIKVKTCWLCKICMY